MSNEMVLTRDEWKAVQQKLADLHFYTGTIDGLRGPLTDTAIVAFKKSVKLAPRSFYGPITHEMLMETAPVSSPIPWYAEASRMLGVHEKTNKSQLKSWFDPAFSEIDPAEIPWCGAFVGTCLRKTLGPDIKVPDNMLGARAWGTYGTRCEPQRGAILTFWRVSKSSWQGHAGFMAGQDKSYFYVLGGNQSDAVTIAKLQKSRLLESRWPDGVPEQKQYAWGNISTAKLSTNEA